MTIPRRRLGNCILTLPNDLYFFGQRTENENLLRIVRTIKLAETTIYVSAVGAFGFEFDDKGSLASIDVLEFKQSGLVPDEIMRNEDEVKALQFNRLHFINFVSAALFGRIGAIRNNGLNGARYLGVDKIVAFAPHGDTLAIPLKQDEFFDFALSKKIRRYIERKDTSYRIKSHELDDCAEFLQMLSLRAKEFEYLDLHSAFVMHFQAAILHAQQQAEASLALNVAVMESLVHEVFLSYGLVGDRAKKPFAMKNISSIKLSNSEFKKMAVSERLKKLRGCGLFDRYLYERADRMRQRRNDLMHGADRVAPSESGVSLTVVRDIFSLLIEKPIDMITSWTIRY